MKKKILCGLFILCTLLIGCDSDIEQRVLEDNTEETESTANGWNRDEEKRDSSEDFSESEDELMDFRLVDGNLYDKVKQNFEYESYDTITLYKFNDNWFAQVTNVGGILPEHFDDYDNDGEKDIIFIDTAFPECVVAYKKVNGSIEVVTVLSDNNFQTYDYNEEYRYITHKDDEFYIVRERQRKYCVNENKESDFVSIEEKRDYYYEWDIEICNLTESMLKQKYIIEEYLRCVEYFENDKLVNSVLASYKKGEEGWNYLYNDSRETDRERDNYMESARKMSDLLDKYINDYRNGKDVIALSAYNIIPVQRDVEIQKNEGECDRIENASIIKVAYNNLKYSIGDARFDDLEEILQAGEESDWTDQSVLKTNIVIDRIKSVDQKVMTETIGNNTVEMYMNDDGSVERISYPDIDDPNSDSIITVDFYLDNNEIIACELVYEFDGEESSEEREIIQDYNRILRFYVKNDYIYRTTDNFSFGGNHDTNITLYDVVDRDWWKKIYQDLNTRIPNALAEDVNSNTEETGYYGCWSNEYDDVSQAQTMYLEFESEDTMGQARIILEGRVEGSGTYHIYEDGTFSCNMVLDKDYSNEDEQAEQMNISVYLEGQMVDNNNIECTLQYVGRDEIYSYYLSRITE